MIIRIPRMKVVSGLVFTLLLATQWIELISALSFDTSGCGDTKGCFRFPDSCESSESCDFLVTYNLSNSDKVDLELSGRGDWVGVGFSDDQKMPDTDIIICVDPSAQPASGHYYADGRTAPPLTTPSPSSVTFLDVVSEDGIVKCKVSRELSPSDANMKDLKGEVFLLGAIGTVDGNDLRQHSQREYSPEKVDIAKATSSSEDEGLETLSFDTSGCGDTKGCFRFPDSCESSESCDFLVTYNLSNSDKVDLELSGRGDWVGVGFSDDQKMPDTDIIICVDPSAQPASGHYYADGRTAPPLTTPSPSSVTFLDVVSEDGIVKCKVSRELSPSDANMKDLKGEVFLLGAIGTVDENGLRQHSQREYSPEKVDVAKATSSSADGGLDTHIIVHGSLMTVAWIGFATVGLFTARYMRQVWEPTEIFGKKAWFQVHRTVMTLTVSLTIAGIVVIFVKIEKWSSNAGAHPYIGIIVLALALAQPIMAFFRPHPGEPRRKTFNWVHRLVGTCALVLAVVTIYLGLDLDQVGLGKKGLYAVITFYVGEFIIFLFEVYLIMSTRRRVAKTASSNKIEGIQMELPNHQPPPEPEMPMKEAMIRTTFFVFALLLGSTVSLTIILLMVLK